MLISTKTQAFDGDFQIIFSDVFNVYENHLKITDIVGYNFEFVFDKGEFVQGAAITSQANESSKTITITLKNFRNQLGAGSTNKLPVVNLRGGRKIYFSIYGKSLSKDVDFLHITVNFYLK